MLAPQKVTKKEGAPDAVAYGYPARLIKHRTRSGYSITPVARSHIPVLTLRVIPRLISMLGTA